MTHTRFSILAIAIAATAVGACRATPASSTAAPASTTQAPTTSASPGSTAPQQGTLAGAVAETMNSGGYTYARLRVGQKDVWIAATEFAVAVGERVTAEPNMPMENFHSKTLNRDFPLIYFVTNVAREGERPSAHPAPVGAPALAGSHEPTTSADAPQAVTPIAPAPGGLSIADVWAKRASLSGKTVVVRGQVVKVNNGIMGRNWFHLQDGSGSAKDATNDLTITSSATVTLGDIVTVSGTLGTGKDFGAGYTYEAIVEDASVTTRERRAEGLN